MRSFTILKYLLLIALFSSCKKDKENPQSKPRGKYLSEIWTKNLMFSEKDSFKYASFDYDANRYLKKINFFDSDGNMYIYWTFFYEKSGKIASIKRYDKYNSLLRMDTMNYKNDSTMLKEVYKFITTLKVFQEKSKVIFNKMGCPVKIFRSFSQNQNIDSTRDIKFCEYDLDGKLESFYDTAFIFGETINRVEYIFDRGKNPFFNLGIDIVHNTQTFPWRDFIGYLPKNNVMRYYYSSLDHFDISIEYDYTDFYPIYEIYESIKIYYFYKNL